MCFSIHSYRTYLVIEVHMHTLLSKVGKERIREQHNEGNMQSLSEFRHFDLVA